MEQGIKRLERRIVELENFQPATASSDDVMALERSIEETLERTFGNDTRDFHRYRSAATLDDGPFNMLGGPRDTQRHLAEGKSKCIALLVQAVKGLRERIDEMPSGAEAEPQGPAQTFERSNDVFIVHGHDDGTRETVARFIAKFGLRPVILHEQPNQGQTVIEKFERNSDVGFAIVLLTPDDVGGVDSSNLRPRARQNVVLELGYFVGKLGRASVCAIVRGSGLELPSDIHGVVWTQYEGNWQFDLAKELKAAGYDIDLNKILD